MDQQLGLFPDEPPAPRVPAVGAVPTTPELRALGAALPSGVRLGTSSWSFSGWEGLVYDRRASSAVLARDGLAAYAQHPLFNTVSVDRTYYRPIAAEDFARYADVVDDEFRFVVKADRLITSPLDPEGYGVRRPNPHFLDVRYAIREMIEPMVEGLGSKVGPLLFQFSPIPANLVGGAEAFVERLVTFLKRLPPTVPYAVELRTPTFLTERYAEGLDDVGAAHAFNVHPAMTPLDRQLQAIRVHEQPFVLVRWMLHSALKYEAAKERYEPFDRVVDEDARSRQRIATALLDACIAERDAFVIANNKAEGSAPRTLRALAEQVQNWTPNAPGATNAHD